MSQPFTTYTAWQESLIDEIDNAVIASAQLLAPTGLWLGAMFWAIRQAYGA